MRPVYSPAGGEGSFNRGSSKEEGFYQGQKFVGGWGQWPQAIGPLPPGSAGPLTHAHLSELSDFAGFLWIHNEMRYLLNSHSFLDAGRRPASSRNHSPL